MIKKPDIGDGPNGELLMTWNTEDHHFEIGRFLYTRSDSVFRA